ncbi:MAG: CcmD family protein [Chloroflexi bacterium]|nr:CcmD family protein [Chloroflexota bacterium]
MDITLKDLLAEIRNLSFLFYGYAAIWLIVVAYIFSLSRRESKLRDEVAELKRSLADEGQSKR